jgi:hypothetical protein
MDWATFWATFSQTHLVTLIGVNNVLETFSPEKCIKKNWQCRLKLQSALHAQK